MRSIPRVDLRNCPKCSEIRERLSLRTNFTVFCSIVLNLTANEIQPRMKFNRIYLPLLLSLTLTIANIGQEPTAAVLVDEHSEVSCDDTLGRLDMFFSELLNDPNSFGLVVISGRAEAKHRVAFRHAVLEEHAKWRSFNLSRIKIVRATTDKQLKMQFWRIPLGATEPEISGIDMSFKVPATINPFIAGYETKMGMQICPEIDQQKIFASLLTDNPSARGNIVVRSNSSRAASRKGASILRSLRTKYRIPASRIRLFNAKLTRPWNYDEPIVEYWYLP